MFGAIFFISVGVLMAISLIPIFIVPDAFLIAWTIEFDLFIFRKISLFVHLLPKWLDQHLPI
jgi:hypothetical protein